MRSIKTLSICSFAVVTSLMLIATYDYFVGHKLVPNKPVILSPVQVSAVNASSPSVVNTVTYTNVAGISNVRQLVKSPVEVSYSSDDKTPLTVSTGINGQNSNYLAKFKNYALGDDKNTVLTVTNTGDLKTEGKIEADDGSFGSVDTGKVSLDGVLKFKSRTKDPTKTDSSDKNKYGLLWLGNNGTTLNFMNSDDEKYTLLMQNSTGKLGIGTNSPIAALDINLNGITTTAITGIQVLSGVVSNPTGYNIGRTSVDGSWGVAANTGEYSNFSTAGDTILRSSAEDLILSARNSSGAIRFGSGAADTEKMTILNNGYVGIGITNPTQSLYVHGGNIFIEDGYLALFGDVGVGITSDSSVSNLKLRTQNSDRLVIGSTGNIGFGTTNPTAMLDVNSDTIRIRDTKTPSSATASCNKGEVVWDTSYVYVCIDNDTWKRSALSTW